MATADLENRFIYHPPSPERVKLHEGIRSGAHFLALVIDTALPDSREKSLALTKIEEAMFWANAALARSPEAKLSA